MDAFQGIAVALSMVLGLGVTQLLSAVVAVFRSRNYSQLDWLPLAWAGCIFLWQIQFWWAIIELPAVVESWTIGSFITLLCLTLILFVSAALILPTELEKKESLRTVFERDGRWALVSLSAYFVLAIVADWLFWSVSPISRWGGFLTALIASSLVCALSRSRHIQEIATILFVPLSILTVLVLSPASYK